VKAVNPKYEVLGEVSVSLDAIKSFRQLGSKCPGHPEYRWTSGIETTTGPLGQGLATSVGMAIASRWMAQHFNRPGFTMFDYDVYALCGDGCMMEGISSEAASLAGHLRLANLCWIYDRNKVTIEGHTDLAFTEDVATRFLGYDWNVTRVSDANDQAAIERALTSFKRSTDRPTLIVVESHIGYGAPHKEDTSAAHGEPLGDEEVRLTKAQLRLARERPVPRPRWRARALPGGDGQLAAAPCATRGYGKFVDYQRTTTLADQLTRDAAARAAGRVGSRSARLPGRRQGLASRTRRGRSECPCQRVPWLMGGAADLFPSTKTRLDLSRRAGTSRPTPRLGETSLRDRAHAMGAVINGLALSKVRPSAPGFLIFSDYGRGSLRLGALMESRSSTCSPRFIGVVRMGQRISPSSTSPRSAPFPDSSRSVPRTPTR
jgi:transketolase